MLLDMVREGRPSQQYHRLPTPSKELFRVNASHQRHVPLRCPRIFSLGKSLMSKKIILVLTTKSLVWTAPRLNLGDFVSLHSSSSVSAGSKLRGKGIVTVERSWNVVHTPRHKTGGWCEQCPAPRPSLRQLVTFGTFVVGFGLDACGMVAVLNAARPPSHVAFVALVLSPPLRAQVRLELVGSVHSDVGHLCSAVVLRGLRQVRSGFAGRARGDRPGRSRGKRSELQYYISRLRAIMSSALAGPEHR